MNIKYFATLRDITNTKEETIDGHLPTLQDLLGHLCQNYGRSFSKWVSCENGGFGNLSVFLINGIDSRSLDGYQTKLKESDEISIFPPVAGG